MNQPFRLGFFSVVGLLLIAATLPEFFHGTHVAGSNVLTRRIACGAFPYASSCLSVSNRLGTFAACDYSAGASE